MQQRTMRDKLLIKNTLEGEDVGLLQWVMDKRFPVMSPKEINRNSRS